MNAAALAACGIDYEAGIRRCAEDPAFYEWLLSVFLEDTAFDRACAAREAGDARELFTSLHELKGVAGNAAMTELYRAVCPVVELLRGGSTDPAEIDRLFAPVQRAYARTCEGIQMAMDDGCTRGDAE